MIPQWLFYLASFSVGLATVSGQNRVAIAYLRSENVTGQVTFTETEAGIHVTGQITGLLAGHYGFHVHELGDIDTCDSTGAHFNPDGTTHGGRDHDLRHVGDLGNVEFVDDDTSQATLDFVDTVISLHGRNSILGRGLVLHEQEDDLGLGGHESSPTTGNAGGRVACGVIGIKSPAEPWNGAYATLPSGVLLLIAAILYMFVNK